MALKLLAGTNCNRNIDAVCRPTPVCVSVARKHKSRSVKHVISAHRQTLGLMSSYFRCCCFHPCSQRCRSSRWLLRGAGNCRCLWFCYVGVTLRPVGRRGVKHEDSFDVLKDNIVMQKLAKASSLSFDLETTAHCDDIVVVLCKARAMKDFQKYTSQTGKTIFGQAERNDTARSHAPFDPT